MNVTARIRSGWTSIKSSVHGEIQSRNVGREKAMKSNRIVKMTLVAFAGIWAALPAAAQSPTNANTNTVKISGQVSCTKFGPGAVTPRKGMSAAQTIQYCVNFQGGDYTLVSGSKIYRLTGDKDQLAKVSGQTVDVAGQMVPEQTDVAMTEPMGTVAVSQVAPAKE
jgi:hypothetical protein